MVSPLQQTAATSTLEVCEAAIQLPRGLRVQVNDPQAFRAEFEQLRTVHAPKFDSLSLRAAPLNAHEVWIIKNVLS